MNDMTYTASVLDAQRAAGLRREIELRSQRAERGADSPRPAETATAAAAGEASVVPARRFAVHWHRPTRRSTFVAAR